MSRAHEEPNFTPIKNYLAEAISEQGFSGIEMALLLRLSRLTYGYEEDKKSKRRYDRVCISYGKLASLIKRSERSVERAMKKLIKMNVILVHDRAKTVIKTPGVYGINSDPSTWLSTDKSVGSSGADSTDKSVGSKNQICRLNLPNLSVEIESQPRGCNDSAALKETSKETSKENPPTPQGESDDDFFDQNLPLGSNQVSTIDDVRGLPKDLTFIASFAQADGFLRKFWSAACLSYIETESLKAYYAHNRDQYNPKQLLGNILLAAQEESDRRASTPPDQHRYLGKPIAKTIAAAGPRLLAKRKAATEPQRPPAEDWSRKDRDPSKRRKTA